MRQSVNVQRYFKGEKPFVGMTVHRRTDEPFVIEASEYEVRARGQEVVESGSAEVEDETVFFLLDTTEEHYEAGEVYTAYFTIQIEGMTEKRRMGRVEFRIVP